MYDVPSCRSYENQEDQAIIVPDLEKGEEIKETILESTNLLISSKINEPQNGHKNNVSDTKIPQKSSEHAFDSTENCYLNVDTCDLICKNDNSSRKTVVIWL